MTDLHTKLTLSALWVTGLLNMILRDIHELARPGFLDEIAAMNVPQSTLLAAGIVLEIPVAMILASIVLERHWNRAANLFSASLMGALLFVDPPKDLDDIWFLAMRGLALAATLVIAYRWKEREPAPPLTPTAAALAA